MYFVNSLQHGSDLRCIRCLQTSIIRARRPEQPGVSLEIHITDHMARDDIPRTQRPRTGTPLGRSRRPRASVARRRRRRQLIGGATELTGPLSDVTGSGLSDAVVDRVQEELECPPGNSATIYPRRTIDSARSGDVETRFNARPVRAGPPGPGTSDTVTSYMRLSTPLK